jgi:hypothetical protein
VLKLMLKPKNEILYLMTPFHNPPAGYHFYVICKYCGRISYAKTKRRGYCEGIATDCVERNCNPLYNQNGPRINPVVRDCFGEEFNADRILFEIYDERIQVEGGWSKPLRHSVFYHNYQYLGPLPKGEEILIVGSNALRKAPPSNQLQKLSFQVKPFTLLLDTERTVLQNRIVKGEFASFYRKEEGDLFAPPAMTEKESWVDTVDIIEKEFHGGSKTLSDLSECAREMFCLHHPE